MNFRRWFPLTLACWLALCGYGRTQETMKVRAVTVTLVAVPAFDAYFQKGLGVSTFGLKAMRKIGEFCEANAAVIDGSRVPPPAFSARSRESGR